MKLWIPPPVIENELVKQINKLKQDHVDLVGDYEERYLVTQFINTSGHNDPWDIEQEITRQFSMLLRRNLFSPFTLP